MDAYRGPSQLWETQRYSSHGEALQGDHLTDVVVVGGGWTGLITAYLLAEAGRQVTVVESATCGHGETLHSTGVLSHLHDDPLVSLKQLFGAARSKAVWDSLALGIDLVAQIAEDEGIDCGFRWVPGYLFSQPDEPWKLERERRLAERYGYDCRFQTGPVFDTTLRFEGQALVDPVRFTVHLAEILQQRGVKIYENTTVQRIDPGPRPLVRTETGGRLTCDSVVWAGHLPATHRTKFLGKQKAYRYYVVGYEVPPGAMEEACFHSLSFPSHRFSLHARGDHDLLLISGEEHRTGRLKNATAHFDALQRYSARTLGIATPPVFRWSGGRLVTNDGLPCIGPIGEETQEYAAFGFSGTGLPAAAAAGVILSSQIIGETTPFDTLYRPGRVRWQGAGDFLKESVTHPAQRVADLFKSPPTTSVDEVLAGEGRIMRSHGRRVGVYRDHEGGLHAVIPECPYLGCTLRWNQVERSWDCPHDGSRFTATGERLNGPATTDLETYNIGQDRVPPRPFDREERAARPQ